MKDANQKSKLFSHFTARGWYAVTEVPVFYKGGVFESRRLITDVDVLAVRPTADLNWELVLGDCKTLKDQSPANRAVWLRGLMAHFSADSGIIVLRRRIPIEPDHKLFASSFGVTLLDEEEFATYDRALVFPEGSQGLDSHLREHQVIKSVGRRFPKLAEFSEYLFALAWNEGDLLNVLRRVIGESRSVSREIDPARADHMALILEAISVFTLGLAKCVGIAFKQFLQTTSPAQLDETLKMLIWGGRSQYRFMAKLRSEIMAAKGASPNSPSQLALPEWDRFIELVRELLEQPDLAFRVPGLFRQASASLLQHSTFLPSANKTDLLLLKYGMQTVKYFCRASQFPADAERELVRLFVAKQSELAHKPEIASQQVVNAHSATSKLKIQDHEPEQIELPATQGTTEATSQREVDTKVGQKIS